MNTIQFKYVIPQVFASREEQNSDVWQQDITFEKEKVYLLEAESGKGKSTFCSYLIGYRHDYSGQAHHLLVFEIAQLEFHHLQ